MSITHRYTGLAAACAFALLLAGCSGSSSTGSSSTGSSSTGSSSTGSSSTGSSSTAPSAAPATPTSPAPRIASSHQFYVSLGDSYAAGFQPTSAGVGHTTRNGFAYQTVALARKKGYAFTLVNFGCSGATTSSVLHARGCPADRLGPGAASYGSQTQVAAAEAFLRAHRGKVGLITVSLGGNDVAACAETKDATGCLTSAFPRIKANLEELLRGLRSAAGPTAHIVGTTYPDVYLGLALSKSAGDRNFAKLSVLAFRSYLNPLLRSAYEGSGGTFVDVTRATGGYGPLTQTTNLPPYGTIPRPVAKICTLTYYCQFQDIHPRTSGYAVIAGVVVGALPAR